MAPSPSNFSIKQPDKWEQFLNDGADAKSNWHTRVTALICEPQTKSSSSNASYLNNSVE